MSSGLDQRKTISGAFDRTYKQEFKAALSPFVTRMIVWLYMFHPLFLTAGFGNFGSLTELSFKQT